MAVKIKFNNGIPEKPTFVLMNRSGNKLGIINTSSEDAKFSFNDADELSFDVYKDLNDNPTINPLWDSIVNFKLIWCKEWNKVYEIYVSLDDGESIVKHITATSLGDAETSQIILHDIEINTESDIDRDDYTPTVLYDGENPDASLLDRITDKLPNYSIGHVDTTISGIQRTFQFDNQSIRDAFITIEGEIGCIICIDCYVDNSGNLIREINAYDLLSTCNDCGHRGEFRDTCPKCNSTDVTNGYGEDTTIFVSVDNLTDDIQYSVDTGSVKNCFKLEAGDDLMTATIRSINPNGSDYLYYISDETKEDMSDALVTRLSEYDERYEYYNTEHVLDISSYAAQYNSVISEYSTYSSDYDSMPSSLVGHPAIVEAYYNALDFSYFLNTSLMPSPSMADTTASIEAGKLTDANLSPVAVTNLSSITQATAENAVLSMAKVIVDNRYKVTATTSSFSSNIWRGYFTITNYSDEDDTATSATVAITINSDYETFVEQKINKALNKKQTDDPTDIVTLFNLNVTDFTSELSKYSLDSLLYFRDSCQSCIDVLIEQGIANHETWADSNPDLYQELYVPYRAKLAAIDSEISDRSADIDVVESLIGFLVSSMMSIQNELNIEQFLGSTLWHEFCSYRREDTYSNSNYISDGLTNAELVSSAMEFMDTARNEIYKAAALQHSISSTLHNLLVMKEFRPLVNHFENGNWITVKADDSLFRLRLIEYGIKWDDISELDVTFSDVSKVKNGLRDVENVIKQASSMATSYGAITRQASKGQKSDTKINNWIDNGLSLTTMKIVNTADDQNITWDEHGLLAREYDSILDDYDDKQLKIINRGLYVTDDGWQTAKAGIGNFTFYNPVTQQTEEGYGVIADKLVGNFILGQTLGIYNSAGSIALDEDGLTIKNGTSTVFSADTNGNLSLSGEINAQSGTIGGYTISSSSNTGTSSSGGHAYTNSLYAHSGDGTYEYEVGIKGDGNSSTGTASNLAFYITRVNAGDAWTASNRTNVFYVSKSGKLYADNAEIKGVITATSGSFTGSIHAGNGDIGGWTIGSTSLYKNSDAPSSSGTQYQTLLYAPDSASSNLSAISTRKRTYTDGVAGNWSNTFYVRYDGYIAAYGGGKIGSWNLGVGTGTAGALYNGMTSLSDTTNNGVYLGSDGIALGKGVFKVTAAGHLTATYGSIADWTISANELYKQTTISGYDYRAFLYAPAGMTSTTMAFGTCYRTSGTTPGSWTYPFYVRYDGYVRCNNIDIRGGSINITTSTSTDDKITLSYNYDSSHSVSSTFRSNGIACTDNNPSGNNNGYTSQAWYQANYCGSYFDSNMIWELATRYSSTYGYRAGLTMNKGRSSTRLISIGEGTTHAGWIAAHNANGNTTVSMDGDGGICSAYTWTTLSDRKKKKDIAQLDQLSSAEFIYNLNPVRFVYKDFPDEVHHGFIAQDVEDALDESDWKLVNENVEKKFDDTGVVDSKTTYKTLAYTELIADLVATVQSLNARISQLENMM